VTYTIRGVVCRGGSEPKWWAVCDTPRGERFVPPGELLAMDELRGAA